MVDQLTPVELDSQRPGIRDIWEVGRAPGLFANSPVQNSVVD